MLEILEQPVCKSNLGFVKYLSDGHFQIVRYFRVAKIIHLDIVVSTCDINTTGDASYN